MSELYIENQIFQLRSIADSLLSESIAAGNVAQHKSVHEALFNIEVAISHLMLAKEAR